MQLAPYDLQVAIVAGQYPAQESEVAFVQLHLRSDLRSEPCDDGRQSELARKVAGHIVNRNVLMNLSSPRHSRLLKYVFGKHYKFRRAEFGEVRFKPCDRSAKDFLRRALFA